MRYLQVVRQMVSILVCALLISSAGMSQASAQEARAFVRVEGDRIIGRDGRELLLRGTNLGNWIVPEGYMFGFYKAGAAWQIRQVMAELAGSEFANRFRSRWLEQFITRDDLAYLKSTGINLVRVPLDYRLLTPEEAPGQWNEAGFALIDRLVGWARDLDIGVLLDLHAAPCGQTGTGIDNSNGYPHLFTDPACRARTVEVWGRLAQRYADEPTVIGYDLLNEPLPSEHKALLGELRETYRDIIARIRSVDRNHVLFLGGANWNTDFSVFDGPPLDDNVVYAFHHYQGAPGPDLIRWFLSVKEKLGRPITLMESGENTDDWVAELRRLCEEQGIGWAFWPYKKLDSTSSFRTYARPEGWADIVAYQDLLDQPFEVRSARRIPVDKARAAFETLLANATFPRTTVNPGYIRALGLQP